MLARAGMAHTRMLWERRATKQLKCKQEQAGKTRGEPGEKSRIHLLGIPVQRGRIIPPAATGAAGQSSVQAAEPHGTRG